jgi:hypothetical protein
MLESLLDATQMVLTLEKSSAESSVVRKWLTTFLGHRLVVQLSHKWHFVSFSNPITIDLHVIVVFIVLAFLRTGVVIFVLVVNRGTRCLDVSVEVNVQTPGQD